jgi:hypothetical protein
VGCVTVAMTLSMLVYLSYCEQISLAKFIIWDVKTITAGDYSIEFDISKEFYDDFKKKKGPEKPMG